MKTVELRNATRTLSQYASGLREGPIVVTKGGKPVAALISIRASDLESLVVGTSPEFKAIIRESRRKHRRKGGLSPKEIRARLAGKAGK